MSTHHAACTSGTVEDIENKASAAVKYFTPAQEPPSGTAFDPQSDSTHPPSLFQPLQIRGMKMQNRIILSPLCQYSADDGHMTDWHIAHLGGIISRGTGMAWIEATAVVPEGRITPQDCGIWKDSQIEPLKRVVDFAHSQNQLIGIQLAHAGRKASTVAPWLSRSAAASKNVGGWPETVVAPSAIPYDENLFVPHEMTLAQIEDLKKKWADAVKRSLKAGVDTIEVHAAHGYLLHEFLSPVSNKRTDNYGGSFENRARLTLEITRITRELIPTSMPLFVRISATDGVEQTLSDEPSWTIEESIKLAKLLREEGVDVIDVSTCGNHTLQKIQPGPAYQTKYAEQIKKALAEEKSPSGKETLVDTVGIIDSGKLAQSILDEGKADIIVVGRGFQKNPGLVWAWAEELGLEISAANQIRWGFGGKVGAKKPKA
ncbi:FMN-linked oxidoreductase [Ascobolus immersus RN42]|uniref:FMN-linked oxidoreductase n=1 Tax=Ascobolus immersus RN42 TaxID=1160509 RepID=A0A3N4IIT2_ASCIM|nr:FMN-linked oxidoreductase [Ascobolus immersus RN42]